MSHIIEIKSPNYFKQEIVDKQTTEKIEQEAVERGRTKLLYGMLGGLFCASVGLIGLIKYDVIPQFGANRSILKMSSGPEGGISQCSDMSGGKRCQDLTSDLFVMSRDCGNDPCGDNSCCVTLAYGKPQARPSCLAPENISC